MPGHKEYDAANLLIEKEGSVYSNTTLTPLGTLKATYSFQDDRDGGLAAGFSYTLTGGTVAVASSFYGHQKVLQLSRTSGTVETYQYFSDAPL